MFRSYRGNRIHNLSGLMVGPFAPFVVLWKNRLILLETTLADTKARFAGSVLGIAWMALYPLFILSGYALIYIFVFKVRFPMFSSEEYILLIFCGLIPFLGFAESLTAGIPSLTSNSHLIRSSLFPIELIPVKAVLGVHFKQLVGMVLLLFALGFMGKLGPMSLMLFPLWLLQLMLMVGLAWLLSSINTYVRDVQNASGLMVFFLMIVSPIAYTPEMVPEGLRYALQLNPLYYIIIPWQDVLIHGIFPRGNTFAVLVFLACGVFISGFLFFSRLRSVLVDNV